MSMKFTLVLAQSGNTYSGSWGHTSFRGTQKGSTLSGTWKQNNRAGVFTLILAGDGKSFKGTWSSFEDSQYLTTLTGTRQ